MIHITGKIPKRVAIAVSGGIDSMAVLDFLRRKHDILVLHYNHGTPYAPKAEALVREYCERHSLDLMVGTCQKEMPAGVSHEAWWRDQRYEFFKWATDLPIITAHHLDDQVETYLFTALNGKPFLIPHKREQFIREPCKCDKQILETAETKIIWVLKSFSFFMIGFRFSAEKERHLERHGGAFFCSLASL